MDNKEFENPHYDCICGGGQLLRNLKLTCHSEGTNVTEKSKTNRFFAIARNDGMCHPDTQKKSPLWGESGCAKRSEHTTVREGNNDSNTLSRIRKIPAVSTITTSPRRGKSAFTLAETMIVLVILGVVAAITIPALVNRHMEAERRTKLKKAMTVYDTALNKMVIENGIKSDTALSNWADSDTKNDCANTSVYFKSSQNLKVNEVETKCRFRASDGVFWDISDIKKPLVALREQDLNDETAQSDTNRAFYMFGWFDENGSLRANDLGKISATDKADLQKLYDFINGKTKTSNKELAEAKYSTPCPNECDIVGYLSDGRSPGCHSCSTNFEFNGNNYNVMFDENGNLYKAVTRRMYWEPDISEEIVINSDMTISDKLFYENGDVAVDMTCDFNDEGKCNLDFASFDDMTRTSYEDGIVYTEYINAVSLDPLLDSNNPLYGKNITAKSYYQNGDTAFEFEQKSDGTIKQIIYDKDSKIDTIEIGNIKEEKYCIYNKYNEPMLSGNACEEYINEYKDKINLN